MKKIKKLFIVLMTLSLLIGGTGLWGNAAYAASGRIWYDDPQTAVGDEITIGATAKDAGGNAIGSVEVSMTYDTDYLRFVDGDNVTGEDGELTLSAEGDGTSDTVEFEMTFQALKEGTTVIEVTSSAATTSAGETLTLQEGQSTVTIEEGDPSKIVEEDKKAESTGLTVDMDGSEYEVSENFTDDIIPSGFSEAEITAGGNTFTGVKNANDVQLAYLINTEGTADFYLYDADKDAFTLFQQIKISDGTSEGVYIILLQDDGTLNIPEDTYEKTSLTVNEKEYPTWQNIAKPAYYLLYAISSDGTKRLYQYDSGEGTYQRFDLADTSSELSGILGKIQDFVNKHFMVAAIAVGVVIVLLLLIWLINIIRIHSRNRELDDLYEEFGLYEDDEEEEEPVVEKKSRKEKKQEKAGKKVEKKAEKKPSKKSAPQEKPERKKEVVDDFDDFSDFEGEYDDFDDDFSFDSYSEPEKETKTSKKKAPKRASLDDDFDIDFLDLDL